MGLLYLTFAVVFGGGGDLGPAQCDSEAPNCLVASPYWSLPTFVKDKAIGLICTMAPQRKCRSLAGHSTMWTARLYCAQSKLRLISRG